MIFSENRRPLFGIMLQQRRGCRRRSGVPVRGFATTQSRKPTASADNIFSTHGFSLRRSLVQTPSTPSISVDGVERPTMNRLSKTLVQFARKYLFPHRPEPYLAWVSICDRAPHDATSGSNTPVSFTPADTALLLAVSQIKPAIWRHAVGVNCQLSCQANSSAWPIQFRKTLAWRRDSSCLLA